MDTNTKILIVISVFTGLVALAMIIQAVAMLMIHLKFKALSERIEERSTRIMKQFDHMMPQLESFLPVFKSMVDKVHAMEQNVAEISTVARDRALKLDAFVAETTDSARLQIARLQDVVETTSRRIDETVTNLQVAVNAPIHEVQAIARGIRTGVDVLFGRRRHMNRSHEEEEMFI